MSTKGYFSNLQNRYSANFIAMTSCISLVYAIVYFICHLYNFRQSQFDLTEILFYFLLVSTAILGFIVLFVIFPLSILFYLLLKSKEKHKNFLYIASFILLCIILCIILGNHVGLTDNINSIVFISADYIHMYKILLPIFFIIPALCMADCQKNVFVSNTNLTNNKIYKYCVYFFFYYFWLQYIPFVLGLLFCVYIGLSSVFCTTSSNIILHFHTIGTSITTNLI